MNATPAAEEPGRAEFVPVFLWISEENSHERQQENAIFLCLGLIIGYLYCRMIWR